MQPLIKKCIKGSYKQNKSFVYMVDTRKHVLQFWSKAEEKEIAEPKSILQEIAAELSAGEVRGKIIDDVYHVQWKIVQK